jgi:hypothetical protein
MPRPANPEDAMQQRVNDDLERTIDALADRMGPAAGAKPVSEARKLSMWGQRDPRVRDADGLMQQLMETGLGQTPELLDPENPNCLAIIKRYPAMAEMFVEPVDETLAYMLSRSAEFPMRISVLEPYIDNPDQYVAESDRLERLWNKQLAQPDETPIPIGGASAVQPVVPMTNGSSTNGVALEDDHDSLY